MAAYQIVDLKNTSLSGSSKTVAGVHAKIDGAKCPIRLSGINYGGTKYKDAYVKFTKSGTSYVSETVYGKVITITNTNGITIANPA